jgi:hypothetical protein
MLCDVRGRRTTASRSEQPLCDGAARPPVPALPAWKAFVVQFHRAGSEPAARFSGRVEHLSSGRRDDFSSSAELLAILDRMLVQLGRDPR